MFSAEELAGLTFRSLQSTDPNDLAYLAVTGKIELPIRDWLGAFITREYPELTAAREFRRRDLAILQNGVPLAVIEGKLWISFEANFPSKLHNANPKEGLVAASKSDILKMNEIWVSTGCQRFTSTVLFAADIRQIDARHLPAIKYPNWHHRGLKDGIDLEAAHSSGVNRYREAMSSYGTCSSLRLFRGQVFGMDVVADVVICKIAS
jgi:hypothetical protein